MAKKTELKDNKEEQKFEEALAEIDSIVSKLESGELPLDETLQMFQRGMELINFCSNKLDVVDEKLKTLMEGADGKFSLKDAE